MRRVARGVLGGFGVPPRRGAGPQRAEVAEAARRSGCPGEAQAEPAQPLLFRCVVWGVPVAAVASAAPFVLATGGAGLRGVDDATWLAIGVVTLLVIGGELHPVATRDADDPAGVAWSTPFAFAALIFADVVVGLAMSVAATTANGLLRRRPLQRWLFDGGRYTLALLAAERALALFGVHSDLQRPFAPSSALDILACLVAGAAFFAVDTTVGAAVRGAVQGRTWRAVVSESLRYQVVVKGSQLMLGPLGAVIMLHSPLMMTLGVVPVAAIVLTASSTRATRWAAAHDALTGLANRTHFTALTEASLHLLLGGRDPDEPGDGRPDGRGLALFVLDLDRFKDVNDVLGHPVGDRALREVARRLREAVPRTEVVARLGGDEFAFTMHGISEPAEALAVATRVGQVLAQPFTQPTGHLIDLDASIGIALAPAHGRDVETLFSRADVAMHRAKRDAAGASVFCESHGSVPATRLGLITSLRRALDVGELVLHYQPKVDLRTGVLAGVEALVRWQPPEGGLVPPDEFIPVAEQSGLMPRLTADVLDMALSQVSAWRSAGRPLAVAVNVSLRDMLQTGFAHDIATTLLRHDVPPPLLTLEVTERVLAGDLDLVRATMLELHELGVKLSMDDFGTGWASLQMLRKLPVDEVKLDRTFVTCALDSEIDLAIVVMVTELAHALGMTVVAEGVENGAVLDGLAELGCDQAQGWHVARPMPAEAVLPWWDAVLLTSDPPAGGRTAARPAARPGSI